MQLQQVCEELYNEMIKQVSASGRLGLSSATRIAHCFKVCVEHWISLKTKVKDTSFADAQEEIWFFKSMKPRITAMMEYFTMVYHAELFMPSIKEGDIFAFWKKESEKIKKFYRKHSVFCEYYKSGRTHMDHVYFVRSNKEREATSVNKLYDADQDLIASHGYLATSLLAYDMYESYIMEQVRKVA